MKEESKSALCTCLSEVVGCIVWRGKTSYLLQLLLFEHDNYIACHLVQPMCLQIFKKVSSQIEEDERERVQFSATFKSDPIKSSECLKNKCLNIITVS